MTAGVPFVKIPDDRDHNGVGRPHGKPHTVHAFALREVSSHGLKALVLGALAVQMDFITKDALTQAMHAWVLDKA